MKNIFFILSAVIFMNIQQVMAQCPPPNGAPKTVFGIHSDGHICKLYTETGSELDQICDGKTYKGVGPIGSKVLWKFNILLNIQGTYFFKYKIKIYKAPSTLDVSDWSSYSKVTESTLRQYDAPSGDEFPDEWETVILPGYTYRAKITYKIRRKGGLWPALWRNIESNTWNSYHCLPHPKFQINGQPGPEITANWDEALLMNLSETISCDQKYVFTVQQSDEYWNGFGPENYRSLLNDELGQFGGKNAFDLKKFNASFGNFQFKSGKFYRIKLAVGPPWTEKLILLKVNSCKPTVDYTLNNQSGFPVSASSEEPLLLNFSNTLSCTGDYYLSIAQSDPNGNSLVPENGKWLSKNDINLYGGKMAFNLKLFNSTFGTFDFEEEKYFRVKVAVSEPWTEKVVLLYIKKPCEPSVTFSVNGKDEDKFSIPPLLPFLLNFSNTVSCTGGYFISIQQSDEFWNRTGPENQLWLSESMLAQFGGKNQFDLNAFNNTFGTFVFQKDKYYRIKLAVNDPWTDRTVLMKIGKILPSDAKILEDD